LLNPYLDGEGGRKYLVEEPVNMPESWVCFGKFTDVPIQPGLPMDRNGVFTFGTLNNIYKYTPKMIANWARVMKRVPGSRFMVVRPEVDSYVICKNISDEFSKNGIGPERIFFFNNRKDKRNHLSFYNEIDLSLDTSPLTGGTTTCEAVWMGVPVVSLVGDLFHQRLSYSVLMQSGLENFCAYDEESFVERAVEMANKPDYLRALRHNLRDVVKASPLCDEERFIYQFQEMLEAVADYHKLR
jgi:predicted O-linked N-acetylglucosamine transferase (SPINDLY family)